jgi:hypothetical protein
VTVRVTLPADVNQVDDTGHVWAFLDTAPDVERVVVNSVIVAGDHTEPFLARVVEIVDGPSRRRIVHLDVVGVPSQVVDELRHANLLPA